MKSDFFILNTDNMIGKPLRHVHTPADKASVTFVFEDGMRRSFGVGAGNVQSLTTPEGVEGATISEVIGVLIPDQQDKPVAEIEQILRFSTDRGDIDFQYKLGEYGLQELPE